VIEGLIARVDLTDNLSFGFSWSLKTDINISGLKPFNRPVNLGGDIASKPSGTTFDTGASDGFTFVATDPTGTVRARLTAALKDSKAKILAAPHILVSDNREARIQVGSQVPLATSMTTTPLASGTTVTNTTTSTIQYKDIGIILKVKPQVNDSGLVSLEISQEVSSLGDPVDVAGTKEITINKTEVTTNLVAQDGETIVIGGLIREDLTKTIEGIPFLSKIPIIGSLFSNTTDNVTRTELIILLTPHVIKNQAEAAGVTSDYVDRYKGSTKDKNIDEFIKEKGKKEQDGKDTKNKDLK
jgi:general secretion pathway protein D